MRKTVQTLATPGSALVDAPTSGTSGHFRLALAPFRLLRG